MGVVYNKYVLEEVLICSSKECKVQNNQENNNNDDIGPSHMSSVQDRQNFSYFFFCIHL